MVRICYLLRNITCLLRGCFDITFDLAALRHPRGNALLQLRKLHGLDNA